MTTDPIAAMDSESERLAAIQNLLRAGDRDKARNAVKAWLSDQPKHPEALYFYAVIQRTDGQPDSAMQTLAELLKIQPEHSRAVQELGHCQRQMGATALSLKYYQRATRMNASLIASWQGQLHALQKLGQRNGLNQIAEQIDYLRALPPPLLAVMDLQARGKRLQAEELCKRFMQKNPRHIEGMRLLAGIALEMGALDEAALLLTTAEKIAPANQRVQLDCVQLARRQNNHDEARRRANKLANSDPENLQFQSLAAIEALQVSDFEAALAGFERILEKQPNDPATLTSLGHTLKTIGRAEEAINRYRKATAVRSGHGEGWYALSNLKTYRFDDADINAMEALCRGDELDPGHIPFVRFALGKAYEDRSEYAESFTQYAAGNAAKRQQSYYDADDMHADMQSMATFFDRALFEQKAGSGDADPAPIFIVGLPRAGSTLLEQILSSHSQVDGTQELPNILSMAQQLRRRSEDTTYPEILADIDADELRAMGTRFIADTRIHRGNAPFFIDKMPNNFRHIGLIKLILPNAKIIDARRHPMACCFSGFKQLFAEGQEFSYQLADIGRYYRDYVELMSHWQSVLPGQILQVNNEDVIEDLPGQVARLLEFCGLPFEEQCLHYWETERAVKTPSSEQVRQPVSDKGQHQWRNYSPWLDPLREALGSHLVRLSEES
ncbi:sulfotransferase [Luminiphilus syltensis NOR5-1B]|uniref:Sulfotransferase n=1 Tax=Luminiphilus syltensis NOR5-1B TaxID=565045 RepID=B8KTL5_9GAMM|nr:tetratricopeptide repeat-containing sulfotransferase family protein [Luminiphilus syltensis]EED36455.1 sulfotransferase [Luminiphilus syltensis NOR5-1B]